MSLSFHVVFHDLDYVWIFNLHAAHFIEGNNVPVIHKPNLSPHPSTICHKVVMCGRYRLSRRKQMIEEYFSTVSGEDDWNPRYNIAPTQPVPVIRQNPKEPRRELSLLRWGLIPSWAKDPSIAVQMINARSETAATKPAFRDPLTSRRCLIPADGFYGGRGGARRNCRTVLKLMAGNCSRSRDCGIDGETRAGSG
jgi:SOS response associated peptidase (SRAP)